VLYDGVCVLCNRFVQFIVARDRQRHFLFAPLESEIGLSLVPERAGGRDSVVVVADGVVYERAGAVFTILSHLPFPWPILNVLKVLPHALTDTCYQYIARNRYRWFGQADHCILPTPEVQQRLLAGSLSKISEIPGDD